MNAHPDRRPSPLTSPALESASGGSRGSGLVVGILGGMGPAATADFYLKLVEETPASVDQEHLRTVIWSDPTIPDRTDALLMDGEDPTPSLIAGARMLERSGADMLSVPCNTAHAFLEAVRESVAIPLVHMIEETASHIASLEPSVSRVGLLSTTGTQKAGLYQAWLNKRGVEVITPAEDIQQDLVMAAIRGIKAGQNLASIRPLLASAAQDLVRAGAEAIIGGCTEIPVGLNAHDVTVPFVDPARVLARAVVAKAMTGA